MYGIKPPDPTFVKVQKHLHAIHRILREASSAEKRALEAAVACYQGSATGNVFEALIAFEKAVWKK